MIQNLWDMANIVLKGKFIRTKTKKTNATKNWFFKKINKIDRSLAKLMGGGIDKIRNEKEVTTNTAEIQKIIKDCYKQLYTNKMTT